MKIFNQKIDIRTIAILAVVAIFLLANFGFKAFNDYKMQKEAEAELKSQNEQANLARDLKEKLRDQ